MPDIVILTTVERYFYIVSSDVQLPAIFPANLFTNDNQELVTAFLNVGQNGYVNLYINGIMQEGSLYSVSTSALHIDADFQTIFSDTPIILEIVQYFAQVTSYNLYINAQIQTAHTSTVTATAITIPGGDTLDPATPIVIEFVVN